MHPSALIAFQLKSAIVDLPITVSPDTTVMAAVELMNGLHSLDRLLSRPIPTSCVLIVEDRRLVGILTDRDIVRSIARHQDLPDPIVRDVMTQPVITLDEDEFTDLAVAIDLLCQHRIRYLPLLDRQGYLLGLLTRESLQQKCHPNELWQKQIANLERELADRQIAYTQLEQSHQQIVMSNQELLRVTQLKDEFLTNMSHELRTPLNAVLGMAEGIQKGIFGTVSPAQFQAVKTIEDSSNHLLAPIDDILDLAKIGAKSISPASAFSQPSFDKFDRLNTEIATRKLWKILIVEDNEANINSISSFLKAKGSETILAKNGLEAISIAQSQLPDLILMDIQMPKLDGLEAIRHLRSQPQFVDLPIVALTALAMSGDREKYLAAGATDYLTKPVKL
jgi:CheY-like chemotaxis protein/CBS domain-containing protein